MSEASQIHSSRSASTSRAKAQWWLAGLLLLLVGFCALPGIAGSAAHSGTRTAPVTSRSLATPHALSSCADYAHVTAQSAEDGGGLPAPTIERESPAKKRRPQPQLKTARAFASLQSPDYLLLADMAGSHLDDPAPRLWRDATLQLSSSGDPALRLHRGRAPPLA